MNRLKEKVEVETVTGEKAGNVTEDVVHETDVEAPVEEKQFPEKQLEVQRETEVRRRPKTSTKSSRLLRSGTETTGSR